MESDLVHCHSVASERNWNYNMSCVQGTTFGTPVVPEVKNIMSPFSLIFVSCGDDGA